MYTLNAVYRMLLKRYGGQGWWPIINPVTFESEYNSGPGAPEEIFFEIAIGSILTQNVSWKNAANSLASLKRENILSPGQLDEVDIGALASLIRSSGYFNQKAQKIKSFIAWYRRFDFSVEELDRMPVQGLRQELLSIKGIGPETADSILLYALSKKVFVVDAYTRRIFGRLGIISGSEDYHVIQDLFHSRFRGGVQEFKEYHALIVEHGKIHCRKARACGGCVLFTSCVSKKQ